MGSSQPTRFGRPKRKKERERERENLPLLFDLLQHVHIGRLRFLDSERGGVGRGLVLDDGFASQRVEELMLSGLLAELHAWPLEGRFGRVGGRR
jgi:hypothetical protein